MAKTNDDTFFEPGEHDKWWTDGLVARPGTLRQLKALLRVIERYFPGLHPGPHSHINHEKHDALRSAFVQFAKLACRPNATHHYISERLEEGFTEKEIRTFIAAIMFRAEPTLSDLSRHVDILNRSGLRAHFNISNLVEEMGNGKRRFSHYELLFRSVLAIGRALEIPVLNSVGFSHLHRMKRQERLGQTEKDQNSSLARLDFAATAYPLLRWSVMPMYQNASRLFEGLGERRLSEELGWEEWKWTHTLFPMYGNVLRYYLAKYDATRCAEALETSKFIPSSFIDYEVGIDDWINSLNADLHKHGRDHTPSLLNCALSIWSREMNAMEASQIEAWQHMFWSYLGYTKEHESWGDKIPGNPSRLAQTMMRWSAVHIGTNTTGGAEESHEKDAFSWVKILTEHRGLTVDDIISCLTEQTSRGFLSLHHQLMDETAKTMAEMRETGPLIRPRPPSSRWAKQFAPSDLKKNPISNSSKPYITGDLTPT